MGRITNLQLQAVEIAQTSVCKDRHGALVVRGNRLMTRGCNNTCRTSFLGKLDICQHAEMTAVTSYINTYMRRMPLHKRQRKLSNLTVWSVRVSGSELSNSTPCAVCLYRLREYGFGKVAYSTQTGHIEVRQLSSLSNDHLSSVQSQYTKIIRW